MSSCQSDVGRACCPTMPNEHAGASLSGASRWLGKPSQLARSPGRSRGEQTVDVLERKSGLPAQQPDGWCQLILPVVLAQVVEDLPMIVGQRAHTRSISHV